MPIIERTSRALVGALLLTACSHMPPPTPDVHGHRGARGLLPENAIPGFLRAVELGCDYLELDVVLSGDDQVIVSHEPWMSARICLTPNDQPIDPATEKDLNLYHMTVLDIQQYDCGSLEHPGFPKQKQVPTSKPTLRQVVEAADEHALMNGHLNPSYNIEIKSDPAWYGTYQPAPDVLAARVVREIDALDVASRCIVQSFDLAVLKSINADRDDLTLALLVEKSTGLDHDLGQLGFTPDIYSPHFSLVTRELAKKVHDMGMDLVVWTVNEEADIRRMLDIGVDGIISDHPERVFTLLESRE